MVKTLIVDIETTGLNAMQERITCICAMEKADGKENKMHSLYGEDEAEILKKYWDLYDEWTTVVGFNIDSFDIPFIVKRSIVNNVPIHPKFEKRIKDLRKAANSFFVCYDKMAKGKLSDWAGVMGLDVETHAGNFMPKLFEKRDWSSIVKHCEEDVVITNMLHERLKNLNVL